MAWGGGGGSVVERDLFMNIYFTHKKPCKDCPSLQRIGIVCRCPTVLDHHGSFFSLYLWQQLKSLLFNLPDMYMFVDCSSTKSKFSNLLLGFNDGNESTL